MPHRGARRARPTTADLTRTCGPRGEEWRYGRFSTSHDDGAATVGRAGAAAAEGSVPHWDVPEHLWLREPTGAWPPHQSSIPAERFSASPSANLADPMISRPPASPVPN